MKQMRILEKQNDKIIAVHGQSHEDMLADTL